MSELKDYKVYTTRNEGAWGYHYEQNPNEDSSDIELNGEHVYLKREADKVIAVCNDCGYGFIHKGAEIDPILLKEN